MMIATRCVIALDVLELYFRQEETLSTPCQKKTPSTTIDENVNQRQLAMPIRFFKRQTYKCAVADQRLTTTLLDHF
jgi:hypothetical protein